MTTRKRETLKEFTERAIEATDLGKLIPPIVYLPSRLRMQNQRLSLDNIRITVEAPSVAENHLRINAADPIGFLIAIQNGQPIPAFHVTKEGSIKVSYEVPDMKTRQQVAEFLAHKVTLRSGVYKESMKPEDDWDSIVKNREAARRDSGQG